MLPKGEPPQPSPGSGWDLCFLNSSSPLSSVTPGAAPLVPKMIALCQAKLCGCGYFHLDFKGCLRAWWPLKGELGVWGGGGQCREHLLQQAIGYLETPDQWTHGCQTILVWRSHSQATPTGEGCGVGYSEQRQEGKVTQSCYAGCVPWWA